eukprot:511403_1
MLLLLLSIFVARCISVTISNTQPRYDTSGNIVDAHDGCLVKFNETYYLYGTVYENCNQAGPTCDGKCGYHPNQFAVYSSKDLTEWNLLSNNTLPELLIDNKQISYWMPNVGYNQITKQYIMIYWSGHYGFKNNKIAVAVSDTVNGPFKNVEPIEVTGGNIISSTIAFFIDDNGLDGYVRYNTRDSPLRHVIEKLTPNWLNSTGLYSQIFIKNDYPWYEGGGTFMRNNKYYTMLGSDCCFCQWGGNAYVFIADNSPLNKWYLQSNNETNYCSNGNEPNWTLVTDKNVNPCSPNNYMQMNFTLPSQQFSVSKLNTNNGHLFMYNGENFKSSKDGLKSHDLQTWIPLQFDQNQNIKTMLWKDQWTVQLT